MSYNMNFELAIRPFLKCCMKSGRGLVFFGDGKEGFNLDHDIILKFGREFIKKTCHTPGLFIGTRYILSK
jgi:hypothetical protein